MPKDGTPKDCTPKCPKTAHQNAQRLHTKMPKDCTPKCQRLHTQMPKECTPKCQMVDSVRPYTINTVLLSHVFVMLCDLGDITLGNTICTPNMCLQTNIWKQIFFGMIRHHQKAMILGRTVGAQNLMLPKLDDMRGIIWFLGVRWVGWGMFAFPYVNGNDTPCSMGHSWSLERGGIKSIHGGVIKSRLGTSLPQHAPNPFH